jgi:hypothetical protein
VVLRPPHRPRCPASQGNISTAAVQVQEIDSSVIGRLQDNCSQCNRASCSQGCGRLLRCCWCPVAKSLDIAIGRRSGAYHSCLARQCVWCTQLCTTQHSCSVVHISRLLHAGGNGGIGTWSPLCGRCLNLACSAATATCRSIRLVCVAVSCEFILFSLKRSVVQHLLREGLTPEDCRHQHCIHIMVLQANMRAVCYGAGWCCLHCKLMANLQDRASLAQCQRACSAVLGNSPRAVQVCTVRVKSHVPDLWLRKAYLCQLIIFCCSWRGGNQGFDGYVREQIRAQAAVNLPTSRYRMPGQFHAVVILSSYAYKGIGTDKAPATCRIRLNINTNS